MKSLVSFFALYDKEGRKSCEDQLSQQGLQIFTGLLYLRVLLSIDQRASAINQVKYMNVCWKAFDNIQLPDFLIAERAQLEHLQDRLFEHLPIKNLLDKTQYHDTVTELPKADWTGFRVLPIDVLFYEGPIARAYLEMLYNLRCKPRRIIQLIAKRDLITRKPVGTFCLCFCAINIQLQCKREKYTIGQNISFVSIKNYALEYLMSLVKH